MNLVYKNVTAYVPFACSDDWNKSVGPHNENDICGKATHIYFATFCADHME